MNNKFIIFSQSRSGSTLLKKLLHSHPSVNCEGEILALSDGYINNVLLLRILRRIPIPYFYFRYFLSSQKVFGFTLFNYHTPYIRQCIRLLNFFGWKIIYLKRKQIVNQVFSNIIAMETGLFHRKESMGSKETNFEIPKEIFLKDLKKRLRWHWLENDILMNQKYLTIYYEDDLEDEKKWQATADKIFNYLNLESMPVHSDLKKTYDKPYSEIITNYDELIECFHQNGVSKRSIKNIEM